VLPEHVPPHDADGAGEIIVRKGGQDQFLAVGGGLIEVTAYRVSILTDIASLVDKIDEAKAKRRVSAPWPGGTKSCPPRKSHPSTLRWLALWRN